MKAESKRQVKTRPKTIVKLIAKTKAKRAPNSKPRVKQILAKPVILDQMPEYQHFQAVLQSVAKYVKNVERKSLDWLQRRPQPVSFKCLLTTLKTFNADFKPIPLKSFRTNSVFVKALEGFLYEIIKQGRAIQECMDSDNFAVDASFRDQFPFVNQADKIKSPIREQSGKPKNLGFYQGSAVSELLSQLYIDSEKLAKELEAYPAGEDVDFDSLKPIALSEAPQKFGSRKQELINVDDQMQFKLETLILVDHLPMKEAAKKLNIDLEEARIMYMRYRARRRAQFKAPSDVAEEDENQLNQPSEAVPQAKAPATVIVVEEDENQLNQPSEAVPQAKAPATVIGVEEDQGQLVQSEAPATIPQQEDSNSAEGSVIIDTTKLNVSGIAYKLDKLWKQCLYHKEELLKRTDEVNHLMKEMAVYNAQFEMRTPMNE